MHRIPFLAGPLDLTDIALETTRLSLRSVRLGDDTLIFPAVTPSITAHWIGWEPPQDVEETRQAILESLRKSGEDLHIDLVALEKQCGGLVGCCDISRTDFGDYEVDLWVNESAQGKKYSWELLFALREWALAHTTLPYLVYSVTEGNAASEAIISKLQAPLLRTWEAEKRGMKRTVRDYGLALPRQRPENAEATSSRSHQ